MHRTGRVKKIFMQKGRSKVNLPCDIAKIKNKTRGVEIIENFRCQ